MEKKSLLEMKKQYRRGRRYRKVRYRKPKYKPHTKRIYHEELVDRTKVIVDRDGRRSGWRNPTPTTPWLLRSPTSGSWILKRQSIISR